MTSIVCLDRDGTVNRDENYFLGKDVNWKDQVEILPGVVEGIKMLNSVSDLEVFIVTNQSGVALAGGDYRNMTLERVREVNEYIISLLGNAGALIKGHFICPYVDNKYVEKSKLMGRIVNPEFVRDGYIDMKPNPGMVRNVALSLGKELSDCKVFVIGDRKSDVQLGLNSGGRGILVPSSKTVELGDVEKVFELGDGVYVAKDFLDASRYILERV